MMYVKGQSNWARTYTGKCRTTVGCVDELSQLPHKVISKRGEQGLAHFGSSNQHLSTGARVERKSGRQPVGNLIDECEEQRVYGGAQLRAPFLRG